jgi:hypothetical protein
MRDTEDWATLAEVTRAHVLDTLVHCDGNRTRAAKLLGISVRGLRDKLREYADSGITGPSSSQFTSSALKRQEAGTMKAETMRRNGDNCLAVAQTTNDPRTKRWLIRMAWGWRDLADSQDWLDGASAPLSATEFLRTGSPWSELRTPLSSRDESIFGTVN